MRPVRLVAIGCLLVLSLPLLAAGWVHKVASDKWTWCEDYVYAYATYIVACEPNRDCQVGMGVFAFGQPLGEKIGFSGQKEITVVGVGSLHVRATDGKGPVKVAFIQRNAALIKTPPISW